MPHSVGSLIFCQYRWQPWQGCMQIRILCSFVSWLAIGTFGFGLQLNHAFYFNSHCYLECAAAVPLSFRMQGALPRLPLPHTALPLSICPPSVNKSIYKASTDAHVKQLKCQNYSLHVLSIQQGGREGGKRERYIYIDMLDSMPTLA